MLTTAFLSWFVLLAVSLAGVVAVAIRLARRRERSIDQVAIGFMTLTVGGPAVASMVALLAALLTPVGQL